MTCLVALISVYPCLTLNCVQSTVFDVPLHYNFHRASKALAKDGTDVDLRNVFKHSLVDRHPMGAVTFVDNHE
jgi:alpha-amylase